MERGSEEEGNTEEEEMKEGKRLRWRKMVITQMGRYAPSIHPMPPYPLAHTTGVLIGPVHSVCSGTQQVWRRALWGNAVSAVMLEISKMEKSGWRSCVCICIPVYILHT